MNRQAFDKASIGLAERRWRLQMSMLPTRKAVLGLLFSAAFGFLVGTVATLLWAPPASARDMTATPLPHDPQCTIESFVAPDDHVPRRVRNQLAPDGLLRVGVNYGNPNNASLDASGLLHGPAIDLSCVLARRLGVEVQFTAYPGIATLAQGFADGEWTLGFTLSPEDFPNFAYANPHLAVENTYLVPAGSSIQSVADADQPGIRISVARGNSPDVFLTAHLQYATLVRFDTVPQALAALRDGQVDAFAGSRSAELAFLPQLPGGRLLPDNFLVAYLAQALPLSAEEALEYVNDFVEEGKLSFLLQLAICRAHLVGVSVPAPIGEREHGRCSEHGRE